MSHILICILLTYEYDRIYPKYPYFSNQHQQSIWIQDLNRYPCTAKPLQKSSHFNFNITDQKVLQWMVWDINNKKNVKYKRSSAFSFIFLDMLYRSFSMMILMWLLHRLMMEQWRCNIFSFHYDWSHCQSDFFHCLPAQPNLVALLTSQPDLK